MLDTPSTLAVRLRSLAMLVAPRLAHAVMLWRQRTQRAARVLERMAEMSKPNVEP
jgi:hypothetical protein